MPGNRLYPCPDTAEFTRTEDKLRRAKVCLNWHEGLALQSVAVQAVNWPNVSGHYFRHFSFIYFFSSIVI